MITEAQAIVLEQLSIAFTELRTASPDESVSMDDFQGILDTCEDQLAKAEEVFSRDEVRAFVNENYKDAGYKI